MDKICVYRASGEVSDVTIKIETSIDLASPRREMTLEEAAKLYQNEAARLLEGLKHLPGGTFDALLALMLKERASLLMPSFFKGE